LSVNVRSADIHKQLGTFDTVEDIQCCKTCGKVSGVAYFPNVFSVILLTSLAWMFL